MNCLRNRAALNSMELRIGTANVLLLTITMVLMLTLPARADLEKTPIDKRISLKKLLPESSGGFGYVLEYYLPAPIEAVWRFKTEFDSKILLTKMAKWGQKLVSRYTHERLAALGN